MTKDYVTASELAQYIYCECCWLDELEGKGIVTPAMLSGTNAHEKANSLYRYIIILKKVALGLIIVSIVLALLTFILTHFLGISLW